MIRVDGVEIAEEAISLEAQLQDAPDPTRAWEAAARALVVRQLLLNEAAARGHTGSAARPEPGEEPDEAAIRRLLEAELKLPEPQEAELRRWYDANAERRLRSPDLWHARHILIAADPRDTAACAVAEGRARTLLARIEADPDLLPELARRHSDCPSRDAGGDLGLVERGSTVPEFETFLAGLEPGQVCPVVVKSRFGMHVVQLLHKAEGRVPPFETVRARIAEFLREASWRRAVQGYIGMLAARARIDGFDLFEGVDAAPPQGAWPAGAGCVSAARPSA
jgi:peptidyl-prolyl cis-trans isomerase C